MYTRPIAVSPGRYYFVRNGRIVGKFTTNDEHAASAAKAVREYNFPDCAILVLLGTEDEAAVGFDLPAHAMPE